MDTITIYGKPDCQRCALAKRIMPEAEYAHFESIFDSYDADTATSIVSASGGDLPIIVVESPVGRLVLGASKATVASECNGGTCTIPIAKESRTGHRSAE